MAKAKFDIKTEATRPLYAGVGVTDLAVGIVRDYVADVQKRFARVGDLDLQPQALRETAVTVVNARVDALSRDAKARRAAIETRVAELQAEARSLPAQVQSLLNDGVATATGTYADLAKRGETLVERIRRQQTTQATVSSAQTTSAKAKTTATQVTKATKATTTTAKTTAKKAAKKTSTTARKTAAAPKSSAKATTTAAKQTASTAAEAATDAAAKVGD
jgi:hypothetical protein